MAHFHARNTGDDVVPSGDAVEGDAQVAGTLLGSEELGRGKPAAVRGAFAYMG
jgi:hypothetical protein